MMGEKGADLSEQSSRCVLSIVGAYWKQTSWTSNAACIMTLIFLLKIRLILWQKVDWVANFQLVASCPYSKDGGLMKIQL